MAKARVMRVDKHYAYIECRHTVSWKFISSEFAAKFAERYGGTVSGNTASKTCGNAVKFNGGFRYSVCPPAVASGRLTAKLPAAFEIGRRFKRKKAGRNCPAFYL